MAKQKLRPARPGGFSGAKAYIRHVEVLKKRRNAVGRNFCDAISIAVMIRLEGALDRHSQVLGLILAQHGQLRS